MVWQVPNPSSPVTFPAGQPVKFLGSNLYNTPGTSTCTPPIGAKFVRLVVQGAGAGGQGTDGSISGFGGGQGALQARLVAIDGAPFQVIVGTHGSGSNSGKGGDGGDSSALGFIAKGGKGGTTASPGAGGVGTDGPIPGQFTNGVSLTSGQPFFLGSGSFSGLNPSNWIGGGWIGIGSRSPYYGGQGGIGWTGTGQGKGGDGLDGYVAVEFFG